MNTEKHIAIACFMGATLGALLALQFSPFFWWIGVLIGGAVGYLSFCFRNVVQSVRVVLKEMLDIKVTQASVKKFIIEDVVATLVAISIVISVVLEMGGLMAIFIIMGTIELDGKSSMVVVNEYCTSELWSGGVAIILFCGLVQFLYYRNRDRDMAIVYLIMAVVLNPITMPMTLCVTIAVVVVWLVFNAITKLPNICLKAAWQTFILIHSEIRLLCMTDAMIGSLVGYFCGNAFIGGVVGALLGIVNYRVVSVRWLKLVKT